MDKKPKSNSVITTTLVETPEQGHVLVFSVKDAGEARLVLRDVSKSNLDRAVLHGLTQKVSDAAAIPRDTKTGKSAQPLDKLAAIRKVVEHFASGSENWNLARESGGAGPSMDVKLLAMALVEVCPEKALDEMLKWVRARSVEERIALAESKGLKARIERLRGEASKGVDVTALLAELKDETEGEDESPSV